MNARANPLHAHPAANTPQALLRTRYHAHLVSPRAPGQGDIDAHDTRGQGSTDGGPLPAKQDGRREGLVAGKETRRGMRQGAQWSELTANAWQAFEQAWRTTPEDVFVWSDLHLQHANIIRYAQRPHGGVYHMDESLLANAQAAVQAHQWLLFVGDLAMWKDRAAVEAWMARCPGRKALVLGNHDVRGRECPKRVEDWQALGFEAVADVVALPAAHGLPALWITHYPLPRAALPADTLNVHGHSHTRVYAGPFVNACVEIVGYTPRNLRTWIEMQSN